MSHTPGPWHVDLASGYANVWRVRDEQDRIIGTFDQLGRIPKGADANAILCAAAPAMLDALYLLSHICRNMKAENENHRPSEAAYQVAMRCASAVISKATGEEA